MRIGEVARRARVSVDTVRYYERLGLVESSHRTSGGFREFDADVVARILDVKALQECGVTLEEAVALLRPGTYTCAQADDALDTVLIRLDGVMSNLQAMRDRASTTRARCANAACGHEDSPRLSCC